MKYFLLFLSLLPFFGMTAYADTKLYIIANPINAGDVNQVEGIKTALLEGSPKKMAVEFLDSREPGLIMQKVEDDLANKHKVILVGAGEGGIDGIEGLPPHPNLITCLTSHMLLDRYKDPVLLDKTTFIALPIHVSAADQRLIGSKLILTVGVAHNRNAATVEKTYKQWAKELPDCGFYLDVVLGGDAPLPPPAKGMKKFTKTDALDLASYVTSLAQEKDACVIVSNGPRTGKYDVEGKEVLTVHRKGVSDPISEAFIQKLKDNGVRVTFFDFQHKTPENEKWVKPYNSFDLMLGVLQNHEGLFLVPGDSTSMISEAVDSLPLGKVRVYKDGAMNDVHNAHVESELSANRISVLDHYNILKEHEFRVCGTRFTAANTIAQALLEGAKNKWQ